MTDQPDNVTEIRPMDQRIERLFQAKVLSPIDLLKLRLDVVTAFAVPAAVMQEMDVAYERALEGLVEQAEQAAVRKLLTDGVVPPS